MNSSNLKLHDVVTISLKDIALLISERVIQQMYCLINEDTALWHQVSLWFLLKVVQLCEPYSRLATREEVVLPDIRGPDSEVDFRDAFEATFSATTGVTSSVTAVRKNDDKSDDGVALLKELIEIFRKHRKFEKLALEATLKVLEPENSTVDVAFLDSLCAIPPAWEQGTVLIEGNVTKGFHALVYAAWNSVSYQYQISLVERVRLWTSQFKCYKPLMGHCNNAPTGRSHTNLTVAMNTICNYFEGVIQRGDTFQKNCLNGANGLYPLNFLAVLTHARDVSRQFDQKSTGAQVILYNITSGMLMYVQFYLNIRSLDAARRCALLAVQVGNQLQSDEIIALSHYSCFNVNLVSGRVSEAADSISIALQVSLTQRRCGAPNICNLCLLGAANLLLLHPSVVGASLRSLLTGTESVEEVVEPASPPVKDSNLDTTTRLVLTEQSVAQTVRHALYCSEGQSSLFTGSDLLTEVCLSVTRNTLLLIGSIYGIVSIPLNPEDASVSKLFCAAGVNVDDELLAVYDVTDVNVLKETLLVSLTRHFAYAALLVEEGVIHSKEYPMDVLVGFSAMAKQEFPFSTFSTLVETNPFFSCVLRYVVCGALEREGYTTLAYDSLSELVERLSASSSPRTSDNVDDTGFWPSDHLILLSFIQIKRAELAVYLGIPEDIEKSIQFLGALCSKYHFVFGLLTAQLLEIIKLHGLGCHDAALLSAEKLIASSDNIGIQVLRPRALVLKLTSLTALGQWEKAFSVLDQIAPTVGNEEVALLVSQINIEVEILIKENVLGTPGALNALHALKDKIIPHIPDLETKHFILDGKFFTGKKTKVFEFVSLYAAAVRVFTLLSHYDSNSFAVSAQNVLSQLRGIIDFIESRHLYRGCGSGVINLPSSILSDALTKGQLSSLIK